MRKNWIIVGLVFLLVLLVISPGLVPAQTFPNRTHFVVQVFVDPIYGDVVYAARNTTNQWLNANNAVPPLGLSPSYSAPNGLKYYLIQVPFSFRTINGPKGALNWIKNIPNTFQNYFTNQDLPLTFKSNASGQGSPKRYIELVVIQCLPGLYKTSTAVDPYTGLRGNGEKFPIYIPDRVCIQGTSALNTIFDAGRVNTSVFIMDGRNLNTNPTANSNPFEYNFIDSVSIRGARGGPQASGLPNGAGILIGGDIVVTLTPNITNCFIYDNTVGIAIGYKGGGSTQEHSPKIANNTIAWNHIGIWNGGDFNAPNGTTQATCRPRVLNNIIDYAIPFGRAQNNNWYTGIITPRFSCFEGLGQHELIVTQVGSGTPINVNLDFNAYMLARADYSRTSGNTPISNWPRVTSLRPNNPWPASPSSPRVELSNIMMTGTTRGSLYINDIFWNAGVAGALPNPNFDRSPHDFRLSYHTGTSTNGVSTQVNPLIDWGLDISSGAFPIRFAGWSQSGPSTPDITTKLGMPNNLWTDYCDFDGEDFDCEGFGNLRIYDNPQVTPSGTIWGFTDIGADEVGNLIMAGYVNGTTIYTSENTASPLTVGNDRSFFFGLINGNAYYQQRPQCNWWWGYRKDSATTWGDNWWKTARDKTPYWLDPNSPRQGNPLHYIYGEGPPKFSSSTYRHDQTDPPNQSTTPTFPVFPRNLACDFSPHLITDEHPWWTMQSTPGLNSGGPKLGFNDSFGQNPFHANNPNQPQFRFNNPNLFYYADPSTGAVIYDVVFGVLNAPGTWYDSTNGSYLDPTTTLPRAQWGPFGFSPPNPSIFTLNSTWGFGDAQAGGPDYVPSTLYNGRPSGQNPIGHRYNCEMQDTSVVPTIVLSNLQSFLVVNINPTPSPPPPDTGSQTNQKGGNATKPEKTPSGMKRAWKSRVPIFDFSKNRK